ncbi:MAG: ribosome biogenesis GTPase Der [Actinobacteria bacterium]|jgi:GTP-binding protein|uniref:GTPase Der n=1 Tax=freshwater metagenome TaxID=449393 RepID=A0A6J7AGR2_9ZZZZ|nr:ribosome biogenesis GTPase Der [Actinomycetota bacterium]MSX10853.1 ribosome biogenesis GTPase Der [Actinomycetota bacterium]MSX68578.1 ribosome biogenesis GTPase Der [Actinomycetota bacterium]
MSLPRVVIAGRPNVGKSSLMNRIVGRRIAVVEEHPGVTRDRKAVESEWCGTPFELVDTGGWMAKGSELDEKVSAQAERALLESDVILFTVDAAVGITDEDLDAAKIVNRMDTPVILVVNKVDDAVHEGAIWEFLKLGLGDPFPVSALHGRGTGDLLDAVIAALPDHVDEDLASFDPTTGVAIVGRPNVGKSTLFNQMIGDERSVIHDMPGTTRDAIDTVVETDDGPLRFIDTAGMRRRARTERGAEQHSVIRALDALDRADIALLVIDATIGASHQDQRLAERISAAGCPAVVVLNKWDLVPADKRPDVMATVGEKLAFLGTAPVLRISAINGRGVHKILPAIFEATDAYHQRVPTGSLNRAIRDLQVAHPAPGSRIRYAVQGAIDPPTFTLFASARLPQTYLRYVERALRERFDFGATPMKIRVRVG